MTAFEIIMTVNKREERRYPGICLSVLFSPTSGSNVTELAESYLHATSHDMSISGMSFDVTEPMQVDSELVVSVPNDSNANDELRAIVCWCKQLDEGHYRVGVVFDVKAGIKKPSIATDFIPVLHGPGIPVEATLACPACLTLTGFKYKGMQSCRGSEDELALYNCSTCGTTRSITSLLNFNRELRKSDDK